MNIIRLWGLAGFLAIVLLIATLSYIFAPNIVKQSIESSATALIGSEVNVDSVSFSFAPLGMSINKVQVTNPQAPDSNLVVIEQATMAIEVMPLLWKKLVVNELAIDGVTLNSPRTSEGWVASSEQEAIDATTEQAEPVDYEQQVEQYLDENPLLTTQRIEQLTRLKDEVNAQWKADLDKQAFSQKQAELQQEYDALSARLKKSKLNLIKDAKRWKALRKSLRTEIKRISSLSDKFSDDKKRLSEQYELVKQGPSDDLDRLLENVGLDQSTEDALKWLFGDDYQTVIKQKIGQFMAAENSEDSEESQQQAVLLGDRVYFKDTIKMPELLVKKLSISGRSENSAINGKGNDLAFLPWLHDQPMQLQTDISGDAQGKVAINSHWQTSQKMTTLVDADIKQWPIENWKLLQSSDKPVTIEQADLAIKVAGQLTMKKIDLQLNAELNKPKIVMDNLANDSWQKQLLLAVNQQEQISFNSNITGDIGDPRIELDSSLNKLFKAALKSRLDVEKQSLKQDAKDRLKQKIGVLPDDDTDQLLDQWRSQLDDYQQQLNGILGKIKI
ncbi:MAG: TIGR03545 family protein [Kangiellaceae bacterium]|jgi:uncharacterized protein (TIGR03545 family)|nr:TIGR03545 family protein [Kangiellaceae bacterium]